MPINDHIYPEEKYFSGTSTEWSSVQGKLKVTDVDESSEQKEPKLTGEVKIDKKYGLAKPMRTVIKAKIFTE